MSLITSEIYLRISKSNIYEYEFLSTNFGFIYYYTYDLRIYYDSERPEVLVSQSCPTLCDSMPVTRQIPLSMNSPGKNIGVGCHSILLGILWTQVPNPGLLHCRQTLYQLIHQGSPESSVQRLKVFVLFQTFWSQISLNLVLESSWSSWYDLEEIA